MAARQLDGSLVIISKIKNSFVPSRWLLSDGDDRKAKEVQRICTHPVCYISLKDKRLAVIYENAGIAQACIKADMVILATVNKKNLSCPLVFHRGMSKPGETLFYEFNAGDDVPTHFAGGIKTKKRIWMDEALVFSDDTDKPTLDTNLIGFEQPCFVGRVSGFKSNHIPFTTQSLQRGFMFFYKGNNNVPTFC